MSRIAATLPHAGSCCEAESAGRAKQTDIVASRAASAAFGLRLTQGGPSWIIGDGVLKLAANQ